MELLGNTFGQPATSYTNAKTGATTVTIHLKENPRPHGRRRTELANGIERFRAVGLNAGTGRISVSKVRDEDWAHSWKRHFKPIEIGSELLIRPSWSKRRARKGEAEVVLDPGLSFGTGQHPTTGFCLSQLVAQRGAGAQSFLDIGTGSGTLAIAPRKLGCAPVGAICFDPEVIRSSRTNVKHNPGARKIHFA